HSCLTPGPSPERKARAQERGERGGQPWCPSPLCPASVGSEFVAVRAGVVSLPATGCAGTTSEAGVSGVLAASGVESTGAGGTTSVAGLGGVGVALGVGCGALSGVMGGKVGSGGVPPVPPVA